MALQDWVNETYTGLKSNGIQGMKPAINEFNKGLMRRYQFRLQSEQTHHIANMEAALKTTTEAEFNHGYNVDNETELLSEIIDSAKSNDVFWDIGGNIGIYSCFIGQIVDHVVAFEPFGPNIRRLRENLSLNNVNAQTFDKALADSPGKSGFNADPRGESGGGHGSLADDAGIITVDVETGDGLIEDGVRVPTILKIDVEGAEHEVIAGLKNTLTNQRPRKIWCEVHSETIDVEFHETLESYGYGVSVIDELVGRERYFIRAE